MKPRLHISLLAAASLLTFALGAPCQAATEAPSADKATSYSEEDKDLLDTAQGLFQALPDAAAMQKLRPFTDAQVRLGQQLWFEPRLSRGNTVSCLLSQPGLGGRGQPAHQRRSQGPVRCPQLAHGPQRRPAGSPVLGRPCR